MMIIDRGIQSTIPTQIHSHKTHSHAHSRAERFVRRVVSSSFADTFQQEEPTRVEWTHHIRKYPFAPRLVVSHSSATPPPDRQRVHTKHISVRRVPPQRAVVFFFIQLTIFHWHCCAIGHLVSSRFVGLPQTEPINASIRSRSID